jgi:chromosomal replication initiator protein
MPIFYPHSMTEEQLSTIWKTVLQAVKDSGEFPTAVYKAILKDSQLRDVKEGVATLMVENTTAKSFLQKYAETSLVKRLADQGVEIEGFRFGILPSKEKAAAPAVRVEPALFTQGKSTIEPNPVLASNLNPKYTFATFIVGNRNRLAHAAAKAVAETPGNLYNPLYLYGGVGLGKTHLMQAVGNEIIARDPSKKVLYVSCETFTNEFVTSIQGSKRDEFKRKYRNIDVFLVDDIQFMAGKDGTQEEFFHTFNTLYQGDRQIIITSDKVPSEIKGLEERLSSRFSMGMIADMQLPDAETRQAILKAKCLEKNISLPDSIILYIADHVETNIRELEGALTTVLLDLHSRNAQPSLDEVQRALRAFVSPDKIGKKSTAQQLTEIVCEFYAIDVVDLKGPRRQKELVRPRQILMYLFKNELGMTFPVIGREIGGRDHTTAMHAVNKIEKEMKRLPETLDELQRLKEYFYAHR